MDKILTKRNFSSFFKRREFGVFVVLLVIMAIITIRAPRFFTIDNLIDIALVNSILIIVALGQSAAIITGGIDLSVGSVLALSGMTVGMIMVRFPNISVILLLLIGILIGFVVGLINGIIIGKSKVHPLIITLGALVIYRGLVTVIGARGWIAYQSITPAFKQIARGTFLGINYLIILAIIVTAVFFYFFNYTRKGRELYAYGGNKEAARFVGISGEKVNYLVYAISGTLAGLAGPLLLSRIVSTTANTAKGFEMLTIAACVIGGVSIFGGIGTVMGIIIGTLILGVILNGLELIGISSYWKDAVQGLIILMAVSIDAILSRRSDMQLRKQRRKLADDSK